MKVVTQRRCILTATVCSVFVITFISMNLSTPIRFQKFLHAIRNNVSFNLDILNFSFFRVDSKVTGNPKKVFYPPEKALHDKYIIYKCSDLCGGLADRQKGIVTAYVLSQMLRRKFGIIMTKGCDFSRFVIPNMVNWTVNPNAFKKNVSSFHRHMDVMDFGIQLRDGDLEKIFDTDVSYYQGNIDFVPFLMNKSSYVSLKWPDKMNICDVYRIALNHLFKLAPNTKLRYEEFRKKVNNASLICAHLRMGNSKSFPQDAVISFRQPDPLLVIQFLKKKISSSRKFFIATDSDDVRNHFLKTFPEQFVELKGNVVHIDRFSGKLNCSGMEKVILDQFILSTCDTLVISYSGFGVNAAIMRGTDRELYVAGLKNVTQTKRIIPNYHLSSQYLNRVRKQNTKEHGHPSTSRS